VDIRGQGIHAHRARRGDDQGFEQGNIDYLVQPAKFAPAGGYSQSGRRSTEHL